MMLLGAVGVGMLVVLVRWQRSHLMRLQPPLLPKEKHQLSKMKEIGYINPTYRFHELQRSKESNYY